LVWWYTRKDLTVPLLQISEKFTFTGLFFPNKSDESEHNHFSYKTIFWSDFTKPAEILDQENPRLIIFMGLESAKVIALRIAASKKGIPCILIEHGIKNDVEWIQNSLGNSYNVRKAFLNKFFQKKKDILRTFLFVKDSLKGSELRVKASVYRLMYTCMYLPYELALRKYQFKERLADKYFLLAPFQVKWYSDRDGVKSDRLVCIGNIFYDDFFRQCQQMQCVDPLVREPYALVIDQPILEMSLQDRIQLYKTLQTKLAKNNLAMVVKLHPDDYNNKDLEFYIDEMKEITWVKTKAIAGLIYYSKCCFSFYSTLLIPAIYLKPTFVFNFFNIPIINDWIKMKVITPINSTNLNELDEGVLNSERLIHHNRNDFIKKYLYRVDGESLLRLRREIAIILNYYYPTLMTITPE